MKDPAPQEKPSPSPRSRGSSAGALGIGPRWMSAQGQLRYFRATTFLRKLPARIFPQWVRTILVVFLWLAMTPLYVGAIATYAMYENAQLMTVGLAVFSGIAVHLWPTRTSPWRTIAWAMLLSLLTGMTGLIAGTGQFAVTGATIVGFLVVFLRVNQNGRKLWGLFQSWRVLR